LAEDGVVFLKNTGVSQASGALLWTGKHIITAAHFFDDVDDLDNITIGFNSTLSLSEVQIANVTIHPGWEADPNNFNHDIAIIELKEEVDTRISRYQIYRDFNEFDNIFTRVGYSNTINPLTGTQIGVNKVFHSGSNQYDVTTDKLDNVLNKSILSGMQLSYDFDDGSPEHDAYGQVLNLHDTGTGSDEVFSRPGDSGGPAFIDDKIAGIASYIFRYESATINPDITSEVDSSYGELASDTRVAKYADWIDKTVLGNDYIQRVPTAIEQVDLYPVEVNNQTSTNYFLLSINKALVVDSRVHYETVDGSAIAGSDYIATSGTAVIPAGQLSVAIEVQIIGDTQSEPDENFFLRITDPEGAIFPDGVTELLAEHTIIDNDSLTPSPLISADIIA